MPTERVVRVRPDETEAEEEKLKVTEGGLVLAPLELFVAWLLLTLRREAPRRVVVLWLTDVAPDWGPSVSSSSSGTGPRQTAQTDPRTESETKLLKLQ